MNIAILGTGTIAGQMADTIKRLDDTFHAYAVASRTLEKAEAFASKWNFEKFYGSYDELIHDEHIDLIYIATPHSAHYEYAMKCLANQKPVLVEKAFTANASQAREVLEMSKKEDVLATEAIWTRYMPSVQIVKDLMNSGIIGEIDSLEAEFSSPISHIKRMHEPALAGGALLDLGIYPLTFAFMFFGHDIASFESSSQLFETGVDAADKVTLHYNDGKTAQLRFSMLTQFTCIGIIRGKKGYIKVSPINNFSAITVFDLKDQVVQEVAIPEQISGYEYELYACKKALENNEIECLEMPHKETLRIMEFADELRKQWGVIFPFEK